MINALFGGILIGTSAALLYWGNGRLLGVSGILGRLLASPLSKEEAWRWVFLAGLFLGGILLWFFKPESFTFISERTPLEFMASGFLVGIGTAMANGCTSGHGVCGISRFSLRSISATLIFMAFGILTVFFIRRWS